MRKAKVAINGFGRIGRAFFALAEKEEDFEVVAINDLASKDALIYLANHDSVYGGRNLDFSKVSFFSEKDPENLPWRKLNIDVVIESTGIFKSAALASKHLNAGARKVVVSAPSGDLPVVLVGVNTERLAGEKISSNASCTTNAVSPVFAVLNESLGVKRAMLHTVHAYTGTQKLVDSVAKDMRRSRAAGINIIPTSTGAADATSKAHGNLQGRFEAVASRVPIVAGSLADITFLASRKTSVEEVNSIIQSASEKEKWQGILAASNEPLVSSDIVGRTEAAIVDLQMTRVTEDLVKLLVWYDNEMGYANTLVLHLKEVLRFLD